MVLWARVVTGGELMADAAKSDREIFDTVLEIDHLGDRAAVLEQLCHGDLEQLARVQDLLDAFGEAEGFLDTWDPHGLTTRNPRPEGIKEAPGTVIGNYKLLQEIGTGGFGVVYMAEQQKPVKRKVALKIVKPGMDTREVVARFEAERQALALMSHPNIAQVFDGGSTESGRPYFVMELVKGIPITEFCDKSKLSTKRRLDLFLDICSAIQHAHQKGVIHRDIKPSNVLVTLYDGVPVPKVIDLGIAKAINQELTEKSLFTAYGQMIGTPQYASPEQAEMSGLDIDTRSDIYSLGVLLYELLTGETPISRDEIRKAGLQEVLRLIQEKEPTKPSMALSASCRTSTTVSEFRHEEPSRLVHMVQGDLDWIVLKALEKNRSRRYDTASGFANDIRNYLNHEPVSASPPTFRYLAGKYWRRNRRPILAVLAVFAALLVGISGMTVLYFQADSAEKQAVAERETAVSESARAEAEKLKAQQARDAEIKQRQITQESLEQLKKTLARADFDSGLSLLNGGEPRKALAYLARSLRTNPDYAPTAPLLVSALRDQNRVFHEQVELKGDGPIDQMGLNKARNRIFALSTNGTAQLWNTEPVELLRTMEEPDGIKRFRYSEDGEYLVTWTTNGTLRTWITASAEPAGPAIRPAGGIRWARLASLPEGGVRVATLTPDHWIRVWDGTTGKAITPELKAGTKAARTLVFGTKGEFVGGRFDTQWIVWNLERQPPQRNAFHDARMRTSFYSLAHRVLVESAYDSDEFVAYDLMTGKERYRIPLKGLEYQKLVWLADGRRIVAFAKATTQAPAVATRQVTGRAMLVIDVPTGKVLSEFTVASQTLVPVIDPAGNFTLSLLNFRVLHLRSLKNGKLVKWLKAPSTLLKNYRFSPNGEFFAANAGNTMRVYHTGSGTPVSVCGRGNERIQAFYFSPSGRRLCTTIPAGDLSVWETRTGRPITDDLRHVTVANSVVFDPNETRIFSKDTYRDAAGLAHGTVRIWKVHPTKATFRLAIPERVTYATFGPRSRWIAAALGTNGLRLVDRKTGDMVGPLNTDSGNYLHVDFSPDGSRLAAVTPARLEVWDLATLKSEGPPRFQIDLGPQPERRLNAPRTFRASTVRFSPDGRWIGSVYQGRVARIWNAATGEPATPPLPHEHLV